MAESAFAVIRIDLDDKKFNDDFKNLEISIEKKSSDIQSNLKFEPKADFSKITDSLNKSFLFLTKSISLITSVGSTFIYIQKRFGIFTELFNKVGIDIDKVIVRFEKLIESIFQFLGFEGDFDSLKIQFALLLQEVGLVDNKFLKMISTLKDFSLTINNLTTTVSGFGAASLAIIPVISNYKSFIDIFKKLDSVLLRGKGLFSLVSLLGSVSAGLALVSESLKGYDNQLLTSIGNTAKFAAVILGGLSAALGFAILKVSEFSQIIGSKLVNYFINASDKFEESNKNVVIFSKTVENFNGIIDGGVGSLSSWNDEIRNISDSFNISGKQLTKSAQEIISVTSQMGLNEAQMKKLIRVSSEFAKVNKKDVFDTTLAMVKALNGNSDAVQAYGIKLNQASLQHFAFEQGMTRSIDKMSEHEKIQLRFNKLLKQYSNISGIASTASETLADQNERLSITLDRFKTSLGQGANYIEGTGIVAFGLNKILNQVNENVLFAAGFLGSFGARILQIGGFILEWTFKTYGLIKAIKILNILLSSQVGMKSFESRIPIINKSLNQLISSVSGTQIKVNGLGSLMKATSSSIKSSFNSISKIIFGVNLSAITFGTVFVGILKNITKALGAAKSALLSFLVPLAPIIIKVSLLIGAFKILYEAIVFIDKKTGIFTETWNLLTSAFSSSTSIFDPVLSFFTSAKNKIIELASKGFGLLVVSITTAISSIAAIIRYNPFNVFSKETVEKFSKIEEKLDIFKIKIKDVGFDVRKMAEDSNRSLASIAQEPVNLEQLAALKNEFENFGKSDITLLEEEYNNRLNLINNAFKQELLTIQQYEELKNKVTKDYSDKRFKILNNSAIESSKKITDSIRNGFVNLIKGAMENLGQQLAGGSFSFKSFMATVLSIIADLMLQLAGTFIAIGLGVEAIKASVIGLSAGPALAAGLALALLGGALKAFSSSMGGSTATSSSTPTGGGITTPSDSSFETPNYVAQQDIEERKPDTKIAVNIQGDVLDSEESGLRILDILNSAFDKQGVIISNNARFA